MKKIIFLIILSMAGSGFSLTQNLLSTQQSVSPEMVPNYGPVLPSGKLHLISRYMGENLRQGQRLLNSKILSDGLQSNGLYSLAINTNELRRLELFKPIQGGGPHYWISKHFEDQKIVPFVNLRASKIELTTELRVPIVQIQYPSFFSWQDDTIVNGGASASEAPVTQVNFGLYFQNLKTKKSFAVLIGLYESRGAYPETKRPSNDTQVEFTSSPILRNSDLIEISDSSALLQSRPFTTFKTFKVSISQAQFQKILNIISAQSGLPLSDFRLTMAGILFELPNYNETGNNVSQIDIRNFKVDLVQP